MIDPSEVGHVHMPIPQYPPSDESEGTFRSELRNLVDSQLPPPDDPSSSFTSTQSGQAGPVANGQPSSPSERRKKGSKKDRHSALAQREMVRLLANEEAEAKSMRKYLRAALDRLDGETRRAQEAERRALEIAERFRMVNEARQTAQNELTRVTEELKLWRNQFENAQKEIMRARDIFKDLEDQRNSAESDATKYRSLARKLNEERMVNKAREEGRREGFEEGLRRGMEQGRAEVYSTRRPRDEVLIEDDDDVLEEEQEPMQDRGNGRRAPPEDAGSVMSESIPPLDIPTRVPLNNLPFRNGTQFHENFTPGSTAGMSLAPVPEPSQPPPEPLRMVRPPSVSHNRAPSIVHNRPPSVGHPDIAVPPDNWIPPMSNDNTIPIPPPHEFITRTGSPYSDNQPLPIPGPNNNVISNIAYVPPVEPVMRDIYAGKTKSSPPSITDSLQSTNVSTNVSAYEILAPTRGPRRDKAGPPPPLDRIDEVSSSMEYSPGYDRRSIPAPVTFPVASADSEWADGSQGGRSRKNSHQSMSGNGTPRSRTMSQGGQQQPRSADLSRYSSTSSIDDWRREAAHNVDPKPVREPKVYPSNSMSSSKPVYPSGLRNEFSSSSSLRDQGRPRSVTAPRPRSPVSGPRMSTPTSPAPTATTEYSFRIEPPSESQSLSSPKNPDIVQTPGLLSPNNGPAPRPLPTDLDEVATEPNTPTMRQQQPFAIGQPPPPSVGGFPPGFIPMPAVPSRPSTTAPSTAPPMQQSKTHPDGVPAGMPGMPGGLPGGPTWSMRTGPGPDRAASAQGRPRMTPQMSYESAPMPEGISYPTPPFGRPRDSPRAPAAPLDSMSPRSNTTRLSGGAGSHQRSLSLNAGATPGMSTLPLSGNPAPKLRKMPSSESVGSHLSGKSRASGSVSHFDPKQYVDIAALASSENLLANMQSPTTAANTRANASASMRSLGATLRPGSVAASPAAGPAVLPAAGPPFTSGWGQSSPVVAPLPEPEPEPEPAPAPTRAPAWGKAAGKKGRRR
ncbi:hypothetical protein EIP91_005278 [Steccherinum ochraceum]|uniref:Uncharacterized protein n=1 Tax=Steccherinum ochraceum TaxID=92696 RepID=A0A4R0RQI5_9APHY|nr:hypothetical protein EIP91_005278 [Steccherinum ochraceum]